MTTPAARRRRDGPTIAREIGFTRGDGGFQFENAMADVAIGDIVSPLVGLVLYGLFRRAGGGQPLRQGNGLPAERI